MQALPLMGLRAGLEPLRVESAAELAPVLADTLVHTFIGGGGTVQATVSTTADGLTAEVAWVIGTRY